MTRTESSVALVALNRAADRVYLKPVWLADEIRQDGPQAIDILKSNPAQFGRLKPCLDNGARERGLAKLISAANAFYLAQINEPIGNSRSEAGSNLI